MDQAELLADIQSASEAVSELANLDHPDQQDVFYTTASEVRAALCLTRRAAEVQTDLAFQLTERLPAVWKALHDGLIDLPRGRVISDQTSHLPRELARNVPMPPWSEHPIRPPGNSKLGYSGSSSRPTLPRPVTATSAEWRSGG